MSDDAKQTLIALANMVYQSQACVLEILMSDNGVMAHLIPKQIWEEEGGDFDE